MRSPAMVQRLRRAACGLALLAVTATWASAALAAPEKVAGGIRFTFHDTNAKTVDWAGAFNNWNATANPMVRGSDGTWSIVLALPAGEQQYKLVVDGQWLADPENGATAGDYGNSVVKIGADGSLVVQQATSNTAYSPKIFLGGRTIGLYQGDYDPNNGRYELTRPSFDIDLDLSIRVSDIMQAHTLLNINPQQEDVQAYRARLNLKRASLIMTQPGLQVMAYDSETFGSWDDPLALIGNLGEYHHPYGYNRQGVKVTAERAGFKLEALYDDNFDDRLITNSPLYVGYTIDNFPTYAIGPTTAPSFVWETNPIGKSISMLRTQRTSTGYALAPNQATKITTMDMGDNGRLFGYGDNNKNTGAMRIGHSFLAGLDASVLARTDRGFNLGRMVYTEATGDSSMRVTNALYSQEWYGGGGEVRWAPRQNIKAFAELLAGARRMSFVNGSVVSDFRATRITADSAYGAASSSNSAIDGTHMTSDHGLRGTLGGSWTFARGDIALRGDVTTETHNQPLWTQSTVVPAGLPPGDSHQNFRTVDFQRANYLGPDDELKNRMTTWHFGWDRNWRYYLNREVLTKFDVEWTNFTYDARTSWEHQLWLPTGNFWLESGQHLVSVDRLTMLGKSQVVRIRPTLEVPLLHSRDMRFTYRGTYDGVRPDRRPRFAESRFGLAFQLTKTVRYTSDTRWAKYNAPDMDLEHGYLSTYNGLVLQPNKAVEISFGVGVDPRAFDVVTNEYADNGRDVYLEGLNANGFIAETNFTSLAPQIAAAEKSLKTLRRIQVQAVVHF
jgi:hypothetical protein